MGETDSIRPQGDKIRKAVQWVAEMLREHPDRNRHALLREAEIRFDLTPKECAYLDKEVH